MIDPTHLLKHVIRPVLKDLDLWSEPAERLVLGTACQESHCGQYLVQLGGGPALGIYQMESATHDDINGNFLSYQEELQNKMDRLFKMDAVEMVGNLYYATAMCRIHYYRAPEIIPEDLPGQAKLWKLRYNTPLGKGTVNEYLNNWQRYVGGPFI